jgi:hypothetical protein
MKKVLLLIVGIMCPIVVGASAGFKPASAGVVTPTVSGATQVGPSATASYAAAGNSGGIKLKNTSPPSWSYISPIMEKYLSVVTIYKKMGNQTISASLNDIPTMLNKTSHYVPYAQEAIADLLTATESSGPNQYPNFIQSKNSQNLIYNRLIITEYLLGRIVANVAAIKGQPIVSQVYSGGTVSDPNTVDSFFTKATTSLAQVRYARQAFTPSNVAFVSPSQGDSFSSKSSSSYSSSTLSVPDRLAGLFVVNEVDKGTVLGTQDNPIPYGKSGFISSSEFADSWSNTAPSGSWIKQRKVSYNQHVDYSVGSISANKTIDFYVYQHPGKSPTFYVSNGAAPYIIKFPMNQDKIKPFFDELAPWAPIIKIRKGAPPEVIGLVKVNPISFPKAMQFQGNSITGGSSFTLADCLEAPFMLYKETLPSALDVKSVGGPGPVGNIILRGIFNGHLQSSVYKQVVNPGARNLLKPLLNNAIYMFQGLNWPTTKNWLEAGNIDYKFLTSLRVTMWSLLQMYINPAALDNIQNILTLPDVLFLNYVQSEGNSYLPVVSFIDKTKDYKNQPAFKESLKVLQGPIYPAQSFGMGFTVTQEAKQ